MKISIIGPCGGGKSTLARIIADKYGLVYFDLDDMFVDYTNITEKNVPMYSQSKVLKDLNKAFNEKRWIMEGIYNVDLIFEKADLIILVKQPIWQTIIWQWKRYFTDPVERKRFGFKHNLILSQIIINQYLNKNDYYFRVGVKYPTVSLFKKILKKYGDKSDIYPCSNERNLFEKINLLI